jgi:phospholipase/carboxylesterase
MNSQQQPQKIDIQGWTFRVQHSPHPSSDQRVMLLLHGHLGNENAMWILTKPISNSYTLLAPRAPVKTGEDQYSWHEIAPQWPGLETYTDLTDQLLSRVEEWSLEHNLNIQHYDVMGFSQGAVMAYALAILHPHRIGKVAALAGLIPQRWFDELDGQSLSGKSFFVAHGNQDDIVPIKKAHQAADWLEDQGAHVTFCAADIGHKLSANCFNGLGEFFG